MYRLKTKLRLLVYRLISKLFFFSSVECVVAKRHGNFLEKNHKSSRNLKSASYHFNYIRCVDKELEKRTRFVTLASELIVPHWNNLHVCILRVRNIASYVDAGRFINVVFHLKRSEHRFSLNTLSHTIFFTFLRFRPPWGGRNVLIDNR